MNALNQVLSQLMVTPELTEIEAIVPENIAIKLFSIKPEMTKAEFLDKVETDWIKGLSKEDNAATMATFSNFFDIYTDLVALNIKFVPVNNCKLFYYQLHTADWKGKVELAEGQVITLKEGNVEGTAYTTGNKYLNGEYTVQKVASLNKKSEKLVVYRAVTVDGQKKTSSEIAKMIVAGAEFGKVSENAAHLINQLSLHIYASNELPRGQVAAMTVEKVDSIKF